MLACAFCYAGQIFYTAQLDAHSHPAIPFLFQGGILMIVFFIISIVHTNPIFLSQNALIKLLFVILIATILCYLIQFWAQRFVKPRYVGLIYTIEPVAALAISINFNYEEISMQKAIGAIAILIAIVISILYESRDKKGEST